MPTVDAERTQYLIKQAHKQKKAALLIGSAGTAKTATVRMFLQSLDMLTRTVNYSFATTMCDLGVLEVVLRTRGLRYNDFGPPDRFDGNAPRRFGAQNAVEAELDKRGGKNFGLPNGTKMTFFIDEDVDAGGALSRRPVVLGCLHFLGWTRGHLTMPWLVSFSSLSCFGPRVAVAACAGIRWRSTKKPAHFHHS